MRKIKISITIQSNTHNVKHVRKTIEKDTFIQEKSRTLD